jgi:hypothetical protein
VLCFLFVAEERLSFLGLGKIAKAGPHSVVSLIKYKNTYLDEISIVRLTL